MRILLTAAIVLAGLIFNGGTHASDAVMPKNAHEAAVMGLLDTAFNKRNYVEAFEKYVGPYYRQHNPSVPDGKEAILAGMKQWLPTVPDLQYHFKHVYSDRDIVVVHSLVTTSLQDRGTAVVDIFRLEKGKVVEHWDVAQPVPEKPLNDNSMF